MVLNLCAEKKLPIDIERKRRVMMELARRGMTLTRLAQMTGASLSYTSEIISGRKRYRSAERRIAAALKLPIGYLFPQRSMRELEAMAKNARGPAA